MISHGVKTLVAAIFHHWQGKNKFKHLKYLE